MEEQCSSESAHFNQILAEDRLMTSPDFVQKPTSSAVSAPFRSEKWIGFVQIGRSMRLNDCMNSIAAVSGIQNPIEGHMRRIFNRISTNMTNDILNDMLSDYADLLKTILVIIAFDDNMVIDDKCISTFSGESTGQSEYQQRVFIWYNVRQQLFAPFYVRQTDGSLKVCFNGNEEKSIVKEISDFIDKWNSEKYLGSISETSIIIDNNDAVITDPNSHNTDTVDTQLSRTSDMANIVDLSNRQPLMDIDDFGLWSPNDNNHKLPALNTPKNNTSMELHVAESAFGTFQFILSNAAKPLNKNNNQNELTDYDQQLVNLVQTCNGGQNLTELAMEFGKFSNIDLRFIAFYQEKYRIINESSFPDTTKRGHRAFVVLNGDSTICGPLFTHDLTGKVQTVFPFDDNRIVFEVHKYIEKLNQTDLRSIFQTQQNPVSTAGRDLSHDMFMNDSFVLMDNFNSEFLGPLQNTRDIDTFGDEIMQQIIQTNDASSTRGIIPPSIEGPDRPLPQNHENEIFFNENNNQQIQSNESDRVTGDDQISVHTSSSSSTHLSNPMPNFQTVLVPLTTEVLYGEPEIVVQPKKDWKTRYSKDLILKPKKEANGKPRQQSEEEQKTKFIGLLQGVGDQRSRITTKVPLSERRKLYLAITVRTINNQYHSLKVILPEKIKINEDRFNRENRLNYLEFDECNPMHFFDLNTRIVYMEITAEEHEKQLKEVPVYMFNLYQNQRLTKEMIRREQLDKCQLAFWLCVKEGENYIPVSQESLSCTITETKQKKDE